MTVPATRAGLLARGTVHTLPPGARALQPPPSPRPLPGAPSGLLGFAMVGQRAAPVWALDPEASVWILLEQAGGPQILGGTGLATPPPDAPPVEVPSACVSRAAGAGSAPPGVVAAPRTLAASRGGSCVLRCGAGAAVVPLASMERILEHPPPQADPHAAMPPGALALADPAGRPALVLDPEWCTGAPAGTAAAPLLAVFTVEGRRLAMPVSAVLPGAVGHDLPARLSGTAEGRAVLAAAPAAAVAAPQSPPGQTLALLLCEVGETTFTLPAAEVTAVIPPVLPVRLPARSVTSLRGIVAHRGEVLPVIEADSRLAFALPEEQVRPTPLLRLALPRPVAMPVARVLGLVEVPLPAITPVAGDPLVTGLATLDGRQVPVCRAAALVAGAA